MLADLDAEAHLRHVGRCQRSLLLLLSLLVEVEQSIVCAVTVIEQMPILGLLVRYLTNCRLLLAHELNGVLCRAELGVTAVVKVKLMVLNIAFHQVLPVAGSRKGLHSHAIGGHRRIADVRQSTASFVDPDPVYLRLDAVERLPFNPLLGQPGDRCVILVALQQLGSVER